MIDLRLGNCLELIKTLDDNSVDAIITDPPYGILKGHKIETDIDFKEFHKECYRVLKDKGFYVFFGMQPTLTHWLSDAMTHFKYLQEVIWNKGCGSFFQPIKRIHENIIIMSKNGSNSDLNSILIPKEDLLDELSLSTIKRDYAEIRQILNSKDKLLDFIDAIDNNLNYNSNIRDGKRNDKYYIYGLKELNSRSKRTDRQMYLKNGIKLNSVIKIMPHNKQGYNVEEFNIKHPTVKPIQLMELLIKLTTNEEMTVLDPFMGSGTTGIACKNLNRHFIGFEIYEDYFDIAKNRIQQSDVKQAELV